MIEVIALDGISGTDLKKMKAPKYGYCIEEILPQGLSILTCETVDYAKIIALQMSTHVAAGKEMWGKGVKQGAVLHMIHVDTLTLAENWLSVMTESVPEELLFGFMTEATLDLAIAGVPHFVEAHSDASLIVVELDAPVVVRKEKLYCAAESLPQYKRLKELADQYKVAVLVVQRSVNILKDTNIRSWKEAACISDVTDRQMILSLDGKMK